MFCSKFEQNFTTVRTPPFFYQMIPGVVVDHRGHSNITNSVEHTRKNQGPSWCGCSCLVVLQCLCREGLFHRVFQNQSGVFSYSSSGAHRGLFGFSRIDDIKNIWLVRFGRIFMLVQFVLSESVVSFISIRLS